MRRLISAAAVAAVYCGAVPARRAAIAAIGDGAELEAGVAPIAFDGYRNAWRLLTGRPCT